MNRSQRGFTLIELMIVIAIIGVLAAIAIPQFGTMVAKSDEATTKGNLGSLRSALSVYYGDMEGAYPMDVGNLNSLSSSNKYLEVIPTVELPKTAYSPGHGTSGSVVNAAIDDGGGLYYNNSGPGQLDWGKVVINCTHQDMKGNIWSTN